MKCDKFHVNLVTFERLLTSFQIFWCFHLSRRFAMLLYRSIERIRIISRFTRFRFIWLFVDLCERMRGVFDYSVKFQNAHIHKLRHHPVLWQSWIKDRVDLRGCCIVLFAQPTSPRRGSVTQFTNRCLQKREKKV